MKDKIRFAVVGYGYIGKRHAEMINGFSEAELVAICDNRTKEAIGLTTDLPFFSSIEDLLNSGIEIDVVTIATPNGLHAKHALIALQNNKHIVVEKPMSLTKTDCEKIIYKALQMHKKVFCVMQNRYSPPSIWLKEIVSEKRLGNIYMVQINCFWNRDDRYYKKDSWHGKKDMDGGTLFTQFSHFIDIMYWLFGDIKNIDSHLYNFNHSELSEFDDSGIVTFAFLEGGVGNINFSTSIWDKNLESSLTIVGEKGSVKIGGQYMNKVEHCHIKDYNMPDLPASNPPNDYGPFKGSAANHQYVFQNVIDVIHNKSSIDTNALEGMKVVEIIEKIYSNVKF